MERCRQRQKGKVTVDRKAIATALAKAQAYRQCGKQAECERWAAELVRLLGCAGILRDNGPTLAEMERASAENRAQFEGHES